MDFVKVLPFAAMLVAPGGSIIAPFVARVFPSMLPSTSKVHASGSAEEDLDNSSNKARESTIKESQLREEEGEKARARFDHYGVCLGDGALRARGQRRAERHGEGMHARGWQPKNVQGAGGNARQSESRNPEQQARESSSSPRRRPA